MPRPKKQHLKQRPDGRYACKYRGRFFYGSTEAEALQAREAYKLAELRGDLSAQPPAPTVAEYIPTWLRLHKSGVSGKCFDDYAAQLENLLPVIGQKQFDQVTVDDAASVWRHYDGYSASTIKRARMLYIALFDTAIENEYCTRNPFRGRFAQPPRAPSGTPRALTDEETALVRSTLHRMQAPVMVMLYAGLRRGEMLALTAADINLKNNLITVSKSVRFDGNRPVITSPKTAAGIRSVPILSVLRPILKSAVAAAKNKKRPAKNADQDAPIPLFPAVRGNGYMSDTAFRRAWDSYLHALSAAAGYPVQIRPHDLRHTYCTQLRDAGVDMHQAMIWMGHADEKMILRVYDHAGEKRAASSLALLEKSLSRNNGSQNGSHRKKQST